MGLYNKALLFYNKKSGQGNKDHQINTIEEHFNENNIPLRIVNLQESSEEIDKLIKQGIKEGVDLFIAAGGDGTVSLIGNTLVDTELPLGILPLGTGNLLAKELEIPQQIKAALDVITSANSERIRLDAINLEHHHYFLNISTGVSPKVMANTQSEEKQLLGVFAYLIHFIQQLLGLKLEKFIIEYDNQKETHTASEILITNARVMGVKPLEWSDDIAINDGKLDIFIIRARNIFDILKILISVFTKTKKKNPIIKSIRFQKYCRIETHTPLQVQADGDPIGNTPIEVHVKPNALSIIVPNQDSIKAQSEKSKQRKENEP